MDSLRFSGRKVVLHRGETDTRPKGCDHPDIALRDERERNCRRTIEALESIIQDSEASREARENAVSLLATVYRGC